MSTEWKPLEEVTTWIDWVLVAVVCLSVAGIGWWAASLTGDGDGWMTSTKCEKDEAKDCPQKLAMKVTGAGVVECASEAYMKCCKNNSRVMAGQEMVK